MLNKFMKVVLDTDQRKLLKLRSSHLILSDECQKESIFKAKKVTDKSTMLDLYVKNLRQKKLSERDARLLQLTGLEDILDILKSKEEYYRLL